MYLNLLLKVSWAKRQRSKRSETCLWTLCLYCKGKQLKLAKLKIFSGMYILYISWNAVKNKMSRHSRGMQTWTLLPPSPYSTQHTQEKLSHICKLNTWGVNSNFKAHEQYLTREQGCVVWCGTSRWWLKKTSNVKFLTGDWAREGYIENSCQQICSKEP